MWEVFDPRDGVPKMRVPFRWMASFLADLFKMDYEQEGKGW